MTFDRYVQDEEAIWVSSRILAPVQPAKEKKTGIAKKSQWSPLLRGWGRGLRLLGVTLLGPQLLGLHKGLQGALESILLVLEELDIHLLGRQGPRMLKSTNAAGPEKNDVPEQRSTRTVQCAVSSRPRTQPYRAPTSQKGHPQTASPLETNGMRNSGQACATTRTPLRDG